jgi:hypothetical protein
LSSPGVVPLLIETVDGGRGQHRRLAALENKKTETWSLPGATRTAWRGSFYN